MNARNKKIKQLTAFFILFYIVCGFLSFNRHSRGDIFNYHGQIFADKAAYYIYLPALFIYNFHAKELPPEIDKKTGYGFTVDTINNKIGTKVTYGVALLQSPFFIITHLLAKKLGYPNDGFSLIYNKMLDVAGVFYADLAFIFLYFFLIRYVPKKVAIIALVTLFLGTNLFHYSLFETGMSHVYSFFLFSVFLYLSGSIFPKEPYPGNNRQNVFINIIFGLVIGLIVMVRQINVIFLPVFFMFNQPSVKDIKNLLKPIFIIICSACIVIIPQLFYWKYLSGHFFMDSYPNERFSNILSPKILYLWFSTNNGLVLYNPLILFVLSGFVLIKKTHPRWSIFLSVYFIFLSYLFSSWWSWFFGGSYGSRPFVEFYALFSLPFCYCIEYIMKNKLRTYLFGSLIILCIGWNLKLVYSYDCVWYGGYWDWQGFIKLLLSHPK